MSQFATKDDLAIAIAEVREDIAETERRLRGEWTDTVRYETSQINAHLTAQDGRINWTLGLVVTLLIAVIGGLIYVAFA